MPDTCEVYRALIEEAAGRAEGLPALGAHLAACGACREFRREREALVGLLGGLGRVNAPDDFEFRLRARINSRQGGTPASFWNLRLTPGLAALVVAVCLLASATAYFKMRPAARDDNAAADVSAPAARQPASETRVEKAQVEPTSAGDVNTPPAVVQPPRRTQEVARRSFAAGYAAAEKRSAERPRRPVNEGTFSVRTAAVISGPGRTGGQTTSSAVALPTSPDTLRVVLRDERGTPYLLPMRSVSFGSQTPVGRAANASRKDKEGVW